MAVSVSPDAKRPTADRLLDAAMSLFLKKGYFSASIADILREAAANSGSLYHAYPTKQDLLLAVLDECAESRPALALHTEVLTARQH